MAGGPWQESGLACGLPHLLSLPSHQWRHVITSSPDPLLSCARRRGRCEAQALGRLWDSGPDPSSPPAPLPPPAVWLMGACPLGPGSPVSPPKAPSPMSSSPGGRGGLECPRWPPEGELGLGPASRLLPVGSVLSAPWDAPPLQPCPAAPPLPESQPFLHFLFSQEHPIKASIPTCPAGGFNRCSSGIK